MKFYSEKLNDIFDTPEALEEAEAALESKKVEENDSTSEEKQETLTKKQLAHNVEEAESKLKLAYTEYDIAKKQVEDLSKKYLKAVDDILNPAKEAVKLAEQERYNAIKKFNEAYGGYSVTYTGDRAAQEMLRALNSLFKKYPEHSWLFR